MWLVSAIAISRCEQIVAEINAIKKVFPVLPGARKKKIHPVPSIITFTSVSYAPHVDASLWISLPSCKSEFDVLVSGFRIHCSLDSRRHSLPIHENDYTEWFKWCSRIQSKNTIVLPSELCVYANRQQIHACGRELVRKIHGIKHFQRLPNFPIFFFSAKP